MEDSRSPKSGIKVYLILFSALVIILGTIGAKFLFSSKKEKRRFGGGPVSVRAQEVKLFSFYDPIESIGTAKGQEELILTSKVQEAIRAIHFEEGGLVQQGDLLVELTSDFESAELTGLMAELTEAEKSFERVKKLVEKKTLPVSRLDIETAKLKRAKSKVNALQTKLSDRLIVAPFPGRIGLRFVAPGTLVSPGDKVATLDDIRKVRLDFQVPESNYPQIKKGQSLQAKSEAYPDKVFEGEILAVDSRVDPEGRSITVRALFENADFKILPGMGLRVLIKGNMRESFSVPEEALLSLKDKKYVYRVKGDQVERVEVNLGKRFPGKVEILKGLSTGDQVVTQGLISLRPGSKIKVIPPQNSQDGGVILDHF